MTTVQTNERVSLPQTGKDYTIVAKLSEIEVDEEFNARQGENAYRMIPELAISLRKNGQLQEVQGMANKKGSAKPWFAVGGFRRLRAFKLIATEDKSDPEVRILIKHFEGDRFEDRLIEARYANLASDGGTDPLRDYEYAARCHYFHSKLGATPDFIAKVIGRSKPTVYTYLKLFEKLTPEVKQTWAAAPDPQKEIPIGKLMQWAKHTPSEQKTLLETYVTGDDTPVYEGGSKDDADENGRPKKRIDKGRPGLKDIKAELERIEEKREGVKPNSHDATKFEYASKALRFVLGDISRIF